MEQNITVVSEIKRQTLTETNVENILDLKIIQTQNKLLNTELNTLNKSRFLPSLNLIASYGTTGFGYDKTPNDFLKFYPSDYIIGYRKFIIGSFSCIYSCPCVTGIEHQVFELVAFVHKQMVYAHHFEVHNIILECFQLYFKIYTIPIVVFNIPENGILKHEFLLEDYKVNIQIMKLLVEDAIYIYNTKKKHIGYAI